MAPSLALLEDAGGASTGLLPLELQATLAAAAAGSSSGGDESAAAAVASQFARVAAEPAQLGYRRADVDAVVKPLAEVRGCALISGACSKCQRMAITVDS